MAAALRISFAEVPDLPYLPELPARGAAAQLVGRGTAWLSGLAVDLQPAGWRLTDRAGVDHRRARSLLRADLDVLEEVAQGYRGPVKVSVAGPWTLAATLERPRGDKVLADHGGRRDVIQSLAEGITNLVDELQRRLPDVRLVVQLDEPLLPAVLAGSIRTASGFSRHRKIDMAEVSDAYRRLVRSLSESTPESESESTSVIVHCCARHVPITLLFDAGVEAVSVDQALLDQPGWDAVGRGLESGREVLLGALPTGPRRPMPTADNLARRVLSGIRPLGLDPQVAGKLIITPACGLAGLDPASAVRALRSVRTAAGIVSERLASL